MASPTPCRWLVLLLLCCALVVLSSAAPPSTKDVVDPTKCYPAAFSAKDVPAACKSQDTTELCGRCIAEAADVVVAQIPKGTVCNTVSTFSFCGANHRMREEHIVAVVPFSEE